jgi:predicted flavoprotein YhiN
LPNKKGTTKGFIKESGKLFCSSLRSVLAIKLLNTTCGIENLVFTREERVAAVAHVNFKLSACAASLIMIAASAADFARAVLRMNIVFHE